jgi:hypothetical protein
VPTGVRVSIAGLRRISLRLIKLERVCKYWQEITIIWFARRVGRVGSASGGHLIDIKQRITII